MLDGTGSLERTDDDGHNNVKMIQIEFEEVAASDETVGLNGGWWEVGRDSELDLLRFWAGSPSCFTGPLKGKRDFFTGALPYFVPCCCNQSDLFIVFSLY